MSYLLGHKKIRVPTLVVIKDPPTDDTDLASKKYVDDNGGSVEVKDPPTEDTDIASKKYVDDNSGSVVVKDPPTEDGDVASKKYVDAEALPPDPPTADTDIAGKKYVDGKTTVKDPPTADGDIASKKYVDAEVLPPDPPTADTDIVGKKYSDDHYRVVEAGSYLYAGSGGNPKTLGTGWPWKCFNVNRGGMLTIRNHALDNDTTIGTNTPAVYHVMILAENHALTDHSVSISMTGRTKYQVTGISMQTFKLNHKIYFDGLIPTGSINDPSVGWIRGPNFGGNESNLTWTVSERGINT